MAAVCKKPKDCKHPSCREGECGKCAWNPRSNYPAWHCNSAPKYQFGLLEMILMIAAGYAVARVWEAGFGGLLIIAAVTILTWFLVLWREYDYPNSEG